MDLLKKTLKKTAQVAKKASSVAIDTANKKVDEIKQKQIDKERKFIEEFPYQHRISVRQMDSTSVDLLLWEVLERDSYVVYDVNEKPIYIIKGTVMMGKHHFVITNPEKRVVGKIRKAIFNMPIPFEKEKEKCIIELNGEEPFELETYISFGEREYHFFNKGLKIRVTDKLEREFKINNRKHKKPVVHIYKKGIMRDRYTVGFDEVKNEILAIALTIGVDIIRFS